MTVSTIEGRFWVRLISERALQQYMEHRGETVRSLAAQVDREVLKEAAKTGIRLTSKSAGVVGHLRSGKRNTCRPITARAIEKCLQAPPGSLFVPQVSHVSRDKRPGTRAA